MKRLLILIFGLIFPYVYSQSISFDPSFGIGGKVFTSFGEFDAGILSCARQSDGKIIVRGYKSSLAPTITNDAVIGRYHPDGSVDTTFGTDGFIFISDFFLDGEAPNSLAVQPDDKILVVGSRLSAQNGFNTLRFNSDGTVDASFGDNGIAQVNDLQSSGEGRLVLIQNDGKIIVAGYKRNFGIACFGAVRYNFDGSLDVDFGVDGGVFLPQFVSPYESEAVSAVVEPDGKIIFGFNNFEDNSDSNFGFLRLNSNGTLDKSFGVGGLVITDFGGFDRLSSVIVVQNSLYAIGHSRLADGSRIAMAKYNQEGVLDVSFGLVGKQLFNRNSTATYDFVTNAKMVGDKIVCSGYGESTNSVNGLNPSGYLYQFNLNGLLDLNFNDLGYLSFDFNENSFDFFTTFDFQPDNSIIAFGSVNIAGEDNFVMAKYLLSNLKSDSFSVSKYGAYPNPFSESVTLICNGGLFPDSTAELYDISGKRISVYNLRSGDRFSISLNPNLVVGDYFLKIFNEKESETIRLVKR